MFKWTSIYNSQGYRPSNLYLRNSLIKQKFKGSNWIGYVNLDTWSYAYSPFNIQIASEAAVKRFVDDDIEEGAHESIFIEIEQNNFIQRYCHPPSSVHV